MKKFILTFCICILILALCSCSGTTKVKENIVGNAAISKITLKEIDIGEGEKDLATALKPDKEIYDMFGFELSRKLEEGESLEIWGEIYQGGEYEADNKTFEMDVVPSDLNKIYVMMCEGDDQGILVNTENGELDVSFKRDENNNHTLVNSGKLNLADSEPILIAMAIVISNNENEDEENTEAKKTEKPKKAKDLIDKSIFKGFDEKSIEKFSKNDYVLILKAKIVKSNEKPDNEENSEEKPKEDPKESPKKEGN